MFDQHVRFGSSGIRGPYQTTATPELALRLGQALGELADSIVVGRDARTTGPLLSRALIAGAQSVGVSVADVGLAPTPTVAFGARGFDIGVVITASHNPAPDNGFKFWRPTGAALDDKGREVLLEGVRGETALAPWDDVGRSVPAADVSRSHQAAMLDAAGALEGEPRIVLDCGNGAASRFTPSLLSAQGASLITLNAQPDGAFPGRPSEPTAANLADLRATVRATGALCGIAHDGDGDRCAAVDERGRLVPGDALLVLLAKRVGADQIAVPTDTSRLVWDALPGVEVEVTPVGDSYVSEALANSGGRFGGEPSGGYILPEVSLCPDGPHVAALVARIAEDNGGLAQLVDELPRYVTLRESVVVENEAKPAVMNLVTDQLSRLGEANTLDGVRVDTDDGWLLVRPSGTEPKVRVTSEARDKAVAEELSRQGLDAVRRGIKEVQE